MPCPVPQTHMTLERPNLLPGSHCGLSRAGSAGGALYLWRLGWAGHASRWWGAKANARCHGRCHSQALLEARLELHKQLLTRKCACTISGNDLCCGYSEVRW